MNDHEMYARIHQDYRVELAEELGAAVVISNIIANNILQVSSLAVHVRKISSLSRSWLAGRKNDERMI